MSRLDLRIGVSFGRERAAALLAAMRDACNTIARMPAHYMTYPRGGPIFPVKRIGRASRPEAVHHNKAYLSSFGDLIVSRRTLCQGACSTVRVPGSKLRSRTLVDRTARRRHEPTTISPIRWTGRKPRNRHQHSMTVSAKAATATTRAGIMSGLNSILL